MTDNTARDGSVLVSHEHYGLQRLSPNSRHYRIVAAAALTACGLCAARADVAWTNDLAILSFDWRGCVASLRERATGRELAESGHHFAFFNTPGPCLYPTGLSSLGDGRYRWRFRDGGVLTAKVRSFGPGWSFEIVEASAPNATALYFGWLHPIPQKWKGGTLNMVSDDDSGVLVRTYETAWNMHSRDENGKRLIFLSAESGATPFVGLRGGLVAGPRAALVPALRKMTAESGRHHTDCSGAWSLGSHKTRGSYLFAEVSKGTLDDWIDLAERGGIDTIHFHNAVSRGHYELTSVLYPKGLDDFRTCADLVHEAGFRVGLHTLTASIRPGDAWITPNCRTDLVVTCRHTLARPLGEDDTEMYVVERPEAHHDTFHGYASNGNTFLWRGELIQYAGIRREKPWCFTGVRRGAWKTAKRGTIPAGEKVAYLRQRYDAFYPAPGSRLAEEQGDILASVFRAGRCDQIYFDGSEGPGNRYAVNELRSSYAAKLGAGAVIEGSCSNADMWWYLSREGAWDHSIWGAKCFQDHHSRGIRRARMADLVEPQMGWWKPRQADGDARGHFLDEMEYFAAKNAAEDAPLSVQGIDLRRQHLTPFAITAQMTVLGWYEHFRRADAFTDEAKALMVRTGVDTRLRQAADGRWMLRRADARLHRVTGVGDGSERFAVEVAEACPAAIRIEALYAGADVEAPKTLVGPEDEFSTKAAKRPAMTATLARGDSAHGRTLVLKATNAGETARGAWAACVWHHPAPPHRAIEKNGSFALWVKGDGKGETLCVQLRSHRAYSTGISDHYVTIGFTGWRRVRFLLRERDAGRMDEFVWPDVDEHSMTLATSVHPSHIDTVGFYLNAVPPGETAEVEVSAVTTAPIVKNVTENPAVVVNGRRHALPFALESGEYAELDGGRWLHFSEKGVPMGSFPADRVELRAGRNEIAYEGRAATGAARAEVSVFTLGKPFPATKDLATLPDEARRRLAFEAAFPVRYAPSQGEDGCVPVLVRPGERAFLELRITGPVANPTLEMRGAARRSWTFPVRLGREDRLFCRDGAVWYVLRPTSMDSYAIVAKGCLAEPLPALTQSTGFVLSSSEPETAFAEIDVIKRYGTGANHPNLSRHYTFGQGRGGVGDTEGILNSNWEAK